MTNLQIAKSCPRKAFLQNNVPSGAVKSSVLGRIMRIVLLENPLDADKQTVDAAVDSEFASMSDSLMFAFEKTAERKRMKLLLDRYIGFERLQTKRTVISKSFLNHVFVMKKEMDVFAHRLIDCGHYVECIRYYYKKPTMSYRGRTMDSQPQYNPDLLALQRCGEMELKKLGIQKPCHAAFYYMKAKSDTTTTTLPFFESKHGENIISYRFSDTEEDNLIALYDTVQDDVSKTTEDEKDCYNCAYNDLCNTVFEKRSLSQLPVVEETPLDLIRMTKAQTKFVMFENGQCRVNAVAGSGKTTIVTLRTLRLLEEGHCKPENILMITFTDKARAEMQSRLRRYAAGSALKELKIDTDKIVVETFNSFGQQLLDKNFEKLGFSKAPSLIDEVEKNDIVVSLLKTHENLPLNYFTPTLNLPNASGAIPQLMRILDKFKSYHVKDEDTAREVLPFALNAYAAELLEIYNAYNAELVARNEIDYEDQLRLLLNLKSYGVFASLPYQHIVIDEFQDSDPNQINLVLEIAKEDKALESIVVVGDEMQAIYGFRNASPENLVNFKTYFPHMVDIPLEDNFRSQTPIIELANRILRKEARIAKVIRANRKDSGVQPAIKLIDDADAERDLYVRQAAKLIKDGVAPKDIAVICRTRAELVAAQKALDQAGVPTVLKVPEIMSDAPYVKAIISLAAFLLDHSKVADLALFRKSLGADPFDAKAVNEEANQLGTVYDALENESERVAFFMKMIEDAREDYMADAFAKKIFEKGFKTANQLMQYCVKYRDYGIKESMATARDDVNAVNLITVHSAKGLEWPVVFLSLRKFKTLEEEHRLLYVAVTRAKEKLLITYPAKQESLVTLLR